MKVEIANDALGGNPEKSNSIFQALFIPEALFQSQPMMSSSLLPLCSHSFVTFSLQCHYLPLALLKVAGTIQHVFTLNPTSSAIVISA